MRARVNRRTIPVTDGLDTPTILAVIGGMLAQLADTATESTPLLDDWRGSDIRIRRVYSANSLRDQIEITWEER